MRDALTKYGRGEEIGAVPDDFPQLRRECRLAHACKVERGEHGHEEGIAEREIPNSPPLEGVKGVRTEGSLLFSVNEASAARLLLPLVTRHS